MTTSGCDPMSGYEAKTVDMSSPAPSPTGTTLELDNGAVLKPPCEEYNTILDEVTNKLGLPPLDDWQYIAYSPTSIWAAPLGVEHLYECWKKNSSNCPFIVDPDAINFVQNLESPGPSPLPFAQLTYITPCAHESDHPETLGSDDGPEWAAWLIDAIGESKYWNSTAIILVWDDWGGWYDHEPLSKDQFNLPFRPPNNEYGNNPADPYEWGFRVPLIVISPYITGRGYISNSTTSFPWRSQSVILQFVEGIFGLSPLGTDDYQNNQTDGLVDMFEPPPSSSPLPYVPVSTSFTPGPAGTCPANGALSYRRPGKPLHRHAKPPPTITISRR